MFGTTVMKAIFGTLSALATGLAGSAIVVVCPTNNHTERIPDE